MPDISIAIPTKNRSELLGRVLVSILGAVPLHKVEEIIIVDETSLNYSPLTRKTIELVSEHTKVRMLTSPMQLVRIRRLLLEECKTPYLYTFDDDVVLTPSTFNVFPFDAAYSFISPRIEDLYYLDDQWCEFPEHDMLLPYSPATKRVPLKYFDTAAVLLKVEDCIKAGCFLDNRNMGEFIYASLRLQECGFRGLYEPNALVYQCGDPNAWHNPEFVGKYPLTEEFNKYMKPNPNRRRDVGQH